jgi:hypothetical protein
MSSIRCRHSYSLYCITLTLCALHYPEEFVVEMEPFQIVYLTGNGDQAVTFMDEFTLQEITAQHLTTTMREADPTNFVTLTLYHIARSDSTQMFRNGTKVGFGGTIYYSSDRTSQEQMISSEYLSFLGRNETKYVAMLQDLGGWQDLERALLMSGLGNMVELVDGDMVERYDDAGGDAGADAGPSTLESHDDMGKSMSVAMYLVAVLVPVAVILLMLVSWGAYRARYHVKWNAYSGSPSSPVWHSDLHKSQSCREVPTATERDAENNIPHDDTSQISDDFDSVRVAVPE